MQNDSSKWEAFGFAHGRVWAVALTCSLACAQPGFSGNAAFADEASDAAPVSSQSVSQEATHVVGEVVKAVDSNLVYSVTNAETHEVQVGASDAGRSNSGSGIPADAWPEDHTVVVPETVHDGDGTEWKVTKIANSALAAATLRDETSEKYLTSIVVKGHLQLVDQFAFAGDNIHGVNVVFEQEKPVDEIYANAFNFNNIDAVEFPEGSLVRSDNDATYSSLFASEVGIPFSSYNEFSFYGKDGGCKVYLRSPYATIDNGTMAGNGRGNALIYFWPDSATQKSWESINDNFYGHPFTGYEFAMAVLSADGYTPDAAVPEGTEAYGNARCNVDFGVQNGSVFPLAPDFEITCKGDSEGKHGWTLHEGTDFTATYYDADGNKLDQKPNAKGTYYVEFAGNGKVSYGSSERFQYTIDPTLSGAVVSHGDADTEFDYDGQPHAPEITVTPAGSNKAISNGYVISYVGDNGYSSSEAPTAAGNYIAYVMTEASVGGGALGQVAFSIKPYKLEGGAASIPNKWKSNERNNVASNIAKMLTVTDADGNKVPACAYTVTYKDADGNDVTELKKWGVYTATITANPEGATGELQTKFALVGKSYAIWSVVQDGELTYNGKVQEPQLKVLDWDDNEVSPDNYEVTYTDADGNVVAADALRDAGTYTATVKAKGLEYANKSDTSCASCKVTIAVQDVASQVQVKLERTDYDYQATPVWFKDSYEQGNLVHKDRKSKAIDVLASVTLEDGTKLVKGVDYDIVSDGDVFSTDEDSQSHKATFTVQLKGNYSGTVTPENNEYTINSRLTHVVTYKGVKFSYAVDNDGKAIITGLGVDLKGDTTQSAIAAAYDGWDGETVTIPASFTDNGKTYEVVGVSDCAFTIPSPDGSLTWDSRDIFNSAKKLVIEKGVKEIGYGAFSLGTTHCDIEEIELNEGLEVIHSCAFGASKVKKIVIPSTVTAIGAKAFGDNNNGNTNLESFEFAKGSQFRDHSEGYWFSNGDNTKQEYHEGLMQPTEILGGFGDTESDKSASPLKEITFPASYTQAYRLIARCPNCADFYFMGDSYPAETRSVQLQNGKEVDSFRIWGWDIADTGLLNILNDETSLYSKDITFRPFAVLGNSASDAYTYTEAYNPETQASDGSKDYAANTFVGTPVATNHGGEVTVDWDIQTAFVNKDYSWTPQEGADFTVKYQKVGSDQQVDKITEAGDYVATLTGNGKTCFGTATANLHVDAATLAGAKVDVTGAADLVYNGKQQTPDVKVTLTEGEGESAHQVVLQPGTDYTVEYVNAVDATDDQTKAIARVTGCGLYAGTVDGQFSIAKAPLTVTVANAAKTFGDDDPGFALSGVEGLVGDDSVVAATFTREIGEVAGAYAIKCTGIDIKDATGKRLVTDNYDVTFVNGTLAISGQAAVDISGDASEVSAITDQTLYGNEVRPSVTVKVGDKTLTEGTDYIVSYKNNNAVGKATATITGIGAYTGTKTVEFNVVAPEQPAQPTDISTAEVAAIADQVLYGTEVRPSVTVKVADKQLVEGTDYVVSYTGNNKVGKATATVTGIGSCTGTKTIEFNVVAPEQPAQPADISKAEVTPVADQVLYGSEVRPSVTVKVSGKELVEGKDYVVAYKDNDKLGKATATITGMGDYTGSITVEFNVVKFVQFPDVQDSDWFYDSVISAVRAGYMNGYANGLFGPNDTLTRGQAACVLANMAGADGTVAYDGQYADIDGSEYYAANTAWAKKIGVMTGYAGTDLFGPADNLTREQMACALYNYARDVDGKDVSVADAAATIAKFSDGDFVSGYATEPVAWAIEHGIMGNGGFINAQGDITRAEMAAMAVNYMTTVHED